MKVDPKTFEIRGEKRKKVNFNEFGDMRILAAGGQTSRQVDIEKLWEYLGPLDQTPKNINQIINNIKENKKCVMTNTPKNSATESSETDC